MSMRPSALMTFFMIVFLTSCAQSEPKVIASSSNEITYQYLYDVYEAGELAAEYCKKSGKGSRLIYANATTANKAGVAKFSCVKNAALEPDKKNIEKLPVEVPVANISGVWTKEGGVTINIEQDGKVIKGFWLTSPVSCKNKLWFTGIIQDKNIVGERNLCFYKTTPTTLLLAILSDKNDQIIINVLEKGIPALWKFSRTTKPQITQPVAVNP